MGEIEPTTTGGTGFPEPPPGYTFHNAHDLQELAALRVALTEKDREIERLKAANEEIGRALGYPEGLVHTLSTLRADLSASQAREREAVEQRDAFESAFIHRGVLLADAESALAAARKALEVIANPESECGTPDCTCYLVARAALNGDSHA